MDEKTLPTKEMMLMRLLPEFHDWNQEEFAEAGNIDPSSVCRYQTGKTKPPRKKVEHLVATARLPMPLVDASLLPALEAACAFLEKLPTDAFEDLEALTEALGRSLSAAARSAAATLLAALAAENRVPWERTGPPCEADRLEAPGLWSQLEPCTAEEREFLLENCSEFHSWALAELLCHLSTEAASDSAARALELGDLACRVAAKVKGDDAWLRGLEGYCLAFLANARRVGDGPRAAGETFDRAMKLWAEGASAHPGLLAEWRLVNLEASLRKDQRRFPEALERIGLALSSAPRQARGRILLKKGSILEQMGEAEGAVEALREAAPLLDPQREPRQVFLLQFTLNTCLCGLERFSEAEALLPEVRELAASLGRELDLVRTRWLEGKVAARLERAAEAEAAFRQVQQAFERRGMPYDHALVSLELSILLLEQGRTAEVRELAGEMLEVFQAEEVHREALAALQVFYDAAQREAATVELARRMGEYFRRAQGDPELRFEEA